MLRYEDKPIIFKHKSRVFAKTIQIERDGKIKNKVIIYQKQMVYYSKKYTDRQKHERDLAIKKAEDLVNNPGKYTQATSYNLDKFKEEEKYDGYYSIVTSEKNLSDKEIRDIYNGLWKIKESFKITKSNLETRPVYVWTKEHIEAHFLTCFISLVILRLIECKIDRKYSSSNVINSLKKTSNKLEHDIYMQNFTNEITKELSNIYNIELSRKYLTLSEIKKILNS